ncbi:conserved hypothetical protein [Leishmania major strain Friedlin]|uniref:Complex 1 LYR protein domain-containing protein n=1 Tax=Leishmania major TaxID=5664 RepID=Q4Q452_LEIMA|nr:conserved hypothetical protein [Leishmania major strain Friedlin]CAJ06332.1 conserved hypothetical protein [Leishmania major strain Friedlin]|eukprot:XP_001685896.1 conserved hypothetical protein [Leishmania major strain Friedlin]
MVFLRITLHCLCFTALLPLRRSLAHISLTTAYPSALASSTLFVHQNRKTNGGKSSMSAAAKTVQESVDRLRGQMIRTARRFRDYNFRQYFVQHVKDDFAALAKLSEEEQRKFLATEGRDKLRQLQRMALVNQMYAKRPLYFDTAAQKPHRRQDDDTGKPVIQ